MEVIIRQATIFDSSTILNLIQELADYEKGDFFGQQEIIASTFREY